MIGYRGGPLGVPSYWGQAKEYLILTDPVLATIIRVCGKESLEGQGNPFCTLLHSIVAQQISVYASERIWSRFEDAIGDMTPTNVRLCKEQKLRAVGLSRRKVSYIFAVSEAFSNGTLVSWKWNAMTDAEVAKNLMKLRGIGEWTAEMFLIFHLLRPNVLPVSDVGLQRACSQHYNIKNPKEIKKCGEMWKPWCSVATWYLWRSLDPHTIAY